MCHDATLLSVALNIFEPRVGFLIACLEDSHLRFLGTLSCEVEELDLFLHIFIKEQFRLVAKQ